MRRSLIIVGATVAVLVMGSALFVALFDWNLLRDRAARWAEARIGRQVALESLHVRLGWRPTLTVSGLRIGNPAWAATPNLLEAARVTVVISPVTLMRGSLVLHDLELGDARLALERNSDGARTWDLNRNGADKAEGARPIVHQLHVQGGHLQYREPATRTNVTARVESRGKDLVVTAEGTIHGQTLRAEVTGPQLLLLSGRSQPYPVKAKIALGATTAQASGTILGLATVEALDLEVTVSGQNLADIERVLDLNVPETPPYKFTAHISRGANEWRFDRVQGLLGDSDVEGKITYAIGKARPIVRGELASKTLDFDDLGPLIGALPKTGPGETASPKQRKEAQGLAKSPHVLPSKAFEVRRWNRMDVDMRFVGKRVLRSPALPIDAVDVRLQLTDSVLRLAPLQVAAAGGRMTGTIELDGRSDTLRSNAQLEFRGLQLAKLFPEVKAMQSAKGEAHGRASLAGQGNSVARLMATADGRISLAVSDGTISNLVLELIGLDVGEALRIFATKDRAIPLRCGIVDLGMKDGIGTTNVLVLDTADTLVVGGGTIDLRGEQLNLTLYPRPKDKSILAARAPLYVKGLLKDPVVRPDAGALAARGVGAALLGIINPLLALAPLVETGPGRDSDCARLMREAQSWSGAAAPN